MHRPFPFFLCWVFSCLPSDVSHPQARALPHLPFVVQARKRSTPISSSFQARWHGFYPAQSRSERGKSLTLFSRQQIRKRKITGTTLSFFSGRSLFGSLLPIPQRRDHHLGRLFFSCKTSTAGKQATGIFTPSLFFSFPYPPTILSRNLFLYD